MDNATVNKWYQILEDQIVQSVFAAFRVKFNVELRCSEKTLYNKIQKTVKKKDKLRKNKEGMQEFLKGTFKIPVNETNLDRAVQASATQHEAELIVQMDSLKKENKKLLAKVTSLQTELSHVSEGYIFQLDNITQVNQEMKALLLATDKYKEVLRKELNKLEAKFAELEKKMNSLEKKLQKCKESKQLIRNLNRKLVYKDN